MHTIDLDTHKKIKDLEARVKDLEETVESLSELVGILQKLIEKAIDIPFEEGRNV